MNMGFKQGFYKVVDELWLGYTEFDNITDTFELLVEKKDTYSYPVEGWIWADSEVEARKALNCYGPKPYDSWVLNEEECGYLPPTPYPTDGKNYVWVEEEVKWKEVTEVPE